jgi:hypothetical protein
MFSQRLATSPGPNRGSEFLPSLFAYPSDDVIQRTRNG